MSAATLYCEDGPRADGAVDLDDGERGHVRSLRLRPGDEIRVTDGAGHLWRATVREGDGPAVRLQVIEEIAPPPVLPVELAFGVARKSRVLWLVEKAVELGVATLQPVEFARSRSVADAGRSASFWDKARRRAVAALKQCGGARLPRFAPVTELEDYLRSRREWPGPSVLLRQEAETPLASALEGWQGGNPARLLLGPEGGLEPAEVNRCREAGWLPASLAPRTLRFETAAVAALALAGETLRRTERGGAEHGEEIRAGRERGGNVPAGADSPWSEHEEPEDP